jgi:3-dehydroquinate synthetase
MVDASTGGKTGCDLPEGKNLVGAFHSPRFVLADVATLSTLPERELKCGLAESVKHALIAAPDLLKDLPSCEASVVARSLAVKVRIVTEDARERGERAKLNLGHTVGHALEIATSFALKHGEAVAIGTVEEAKLAVEKGLAPVQWPNEVASYFSKVGLPSSLPDGITLSSLKSLMRRDKKRAGDSVVFALPIAPGDVRLVSVDLS